LLARTEVTHRVPTDPYPRRALATERRDAEFAVLQDAYRASGGMARGESLARRMSLVGTGGYIDLARRIVGGQLFSFQWHQDFWLPLFQFDPEHLLPREGPRRVLAELRGALDGWGVARWFVTPCPALEGRTPLALLDVDLPAVLAVAHAERVARRS
jgi:hypothetical protein